MKKSLLVLILLILVFTGCTRQSPYDDSKVGNNIENSVDDTSISSAEKNTTAEIKETEPATEETTENVIPEETETQTEEIPPVETESKVAVKDRVFSIVFDKSITTRYREDYVDCDTFFLDMEGINHPYFHLSQSELDPYVHAGFVRIIQDHNNTVFDNGRGPELPRGHAIYYNYTYYEDYIICEFDTDMYTNATYAENDIPLEYHTEIFWVGIIIEEEKNESYWIYLNERFFTIEEAKEIIESFSID